MAEPCPANLDDEARELWESCRHVIETGWGADHNPGLGLQALWICRELRQESRANAAEAELARLRAVLEVVAGSLWAAQEKAADAPMSADAHLQEALAVCEEYAPKGGKYSEAACEIRATVRNRTDAAPGRS